MPKWLTWTFRRAASEVLKNAALRAAFFNRGLLSEIYHLLETVVGSDFVFYLHYHHEGV